MNAGVKLTTIGLIPTIIKIIRLLVVSIVVLCISIMISYGILTFVKNDIYAILSIFTIVSLIIVVYLNIIVKDTPFIKCEATIDKLSNVRFKYDNKIMGFNIVNEYRKKTLKINTNEDRILLIVSNLNDRYSISMYIDGELRNKVQDICKKHNVKFT